MVTQTSTSFSPLIREISLNWLFCRNRLTAFRLTAAARGAALGIQILRRTVRAKQYYGIESDRQFIFGKDPLDNLSYCQYTGRPLCRRHIEWFIKQVSISTRQHRQTSNLQVQGDQIPENIPITITSCRRVGLNDEMLFTNDLFIWEQSPPEYSNQLSNSNCKYLKVTHYQQ